MEKYTTNEDGWYCGYWNQSPLQIKHSSSRPLKEEQAHAHPFSEYYLVLKGTLTLQIDTKVITARNLELIMVEAGETHQILKKEPENCEYIIIKEKSVPQNKL
ncbi:MAG: cupin domain-containing protein [Candidatus Woesearchaeota archaeon]|jgi:quercetin dioxygenase-like cupin family protein